MNNHSSHVEDYYESPVYETVKQFPTCSHCNCFITGIEHTQAPDGTIWHTKCYADYQDHLRAMVR